MKVSFEGTYEEFLQFAETLLCGDAKVKAEKVLNGTAAKEEIDRRIVALWTGVEGGKLQAIKYAREQRNLGLKDAKDYCENIVGEFFLPLSAQTPPASP